MKFKNRREEIQAKIAAQEFEKANEKAYRAMRERMAEMSVPLLHPDHKLPTTRRELVGAGILTGMAYTLSPGLLSMISKRAYAQDELECTSGGDMGSNGNKIPGFLQVNARGGWSPAHQVAPGKNLGGAFEPLSAAAYATNALGPSQLPGAVEMIEGYGVQIHPSSPFFNAVRAVLSPEAFEVTRWAFMAQASGDDTGNNQLDVTKFAAKVQGLQFALTPIAGSNRNRETVADPTIPIAPIQNEGGLANLVDPGLIASRLSRDAAIRVSMASSKLSESKLRAFHAMDMPQQVRELIQCGYIGSKDLLSEYTEDRLRPSTDQDLAANFGNLTRNQVMQNSNYSLGLIMGKLLSEGLASSASIEMSGYDYHGRGRNAQDQRDAELGTVVGLALETAFRKNSPLFLAITSDGSVSSRGSGGANDRYDFNSDSGTRGGIIMAAIDPAGAPEMKKGTIGAFTDSGAVNTSYLVTSNSPQLGALGVAYNYAAFAGLLSNFSKEMSAAGLNNPFDEQEYLAFAPKS